MPSSLKQSKREMRQRHAWQRQERATAERFKGKLTPGSGSGRVRGDVQVPGVARIECKSTIHASYRVTVETIEKLRAATFGGREVPVLQIDMTAPNGDTVRCYVLPDEAMCDLLDRVGAQHDEREG